MRGPSKDLPGLPAPQLPVPELAERETAAGSPWRPQASTTERKLGGGTN